MAEAEIAIVRIAPETSFKNKAYEALKEAILKMDIYATPEPVMLDERALLRLPVMLANRRALFHVAERSGISLRLLRRLGSKMAGDGIWYARSQLVKLEHGLECCKK